jgi:hypothetical protein
VWVLRLELRHRLDELSYICGVIIGHAESVIRIVSVHGEGLDDAGAESAPFELRNGLCGRGIA